MRAVIGWLTSVGEIVRRVIGVPDYDRYLAHMRRRHPECVPLDHERFIAESLQARYDKPGSRCC
jgi:uncharacterized short protein YbdD (DUF466 family)